MNKAGIPGGENLPVLFLKIVRANSLNVKSLKIGTNVRLIRSFGTMPKTVGCSLYKGHPFHFVLA